MPLTQLFQYNPDTKLSFVNDDIAQLIAAVNTNTTAIATANAAIAALPALAHGDYSPTLTAVANVTASATLSCQYLRVGNTVTVSGAVAVTPTAATTNTQLGVSLPVSVASFANSSKLGGAGVFVTGTTQTSAQIIGDTTNLRATLTFVSLSTAQHIFRFTFSYKVT